MYIKQQKRKKLLVFPKFNRRIETPDAFVLYKTDRKNKFQWRRSPLKAVRCRGVICIQQVMPAASVKNTYGAIFFFSPSWKSTKIPLVLFDRVIPISIRNFINAADPDGSFSATFKQNHSATTITVQEWKISAVKFKSKFKKKKNVQKASIHPF